MGYVLRLVETRTFGQNLKALRERAGFKTAKSLADALGVVPSVISKMENDLQGLPETPTLLRLAKVLRCSIDELLGGLDSGYSVARAVAHYEETMGFMRELISKARAEMVANESLPEDFEARSAVMIRIAGEQLRWALLKDNEALDDSDLPDHSVVSDSPLHRGGSDVPASASLEARIRELETQLAEREDRLRAAEDAARHLAELLTRHGEERGVAHEDHQPPGEAPGSRPRRGKAS